MCEGGSWCVNIISSISGNSAFSELGAWYPLPMPYLSISGNSAVSKCAGERGRRGWGDLSSSFPGILHFLGWRVDLLIQTSFLHYQDFFTSKGWGDLLSQTGFLYFPEFCISQGVGGRPTDSNLISSFPGILHFRGLGGSTDTDRISLFPGILHFSRCRGRTYGFKPNFFISRNSSFPGVEGRGRT